jgi:N12 class adenine-specific DNA methylase/CRP-like cAMP-binding protein
MNWMDLEQYDAKLFSNEQTVKGQKFNWFIITPDFANGKTKIAKDLRTELLSSIESKDIQLKGEMIAITMNGRASKVLAGLPLSKRVNINPDSRFFRKTSVAPPKESIQEKQKTGAPGLLRQAIAKRKNESTETVTTEATPQDNASLLGNNKDQSTPKSPPPSLSVTEKVDDDTQKQASQEEVDNNTPSSLDVDNTDTAVDISVPVKKKDKVKQNNLTLKAVLNPNHFSLGDEVNRPEGVGFKPRERYLENKAAIETYRKVKAEERSATLEERSVMAKFNGWGGLSSLFRNGATYSLDGWAREAAKEVQGYYGVESIFDNHIEREQASKSALTGFFTSPEVVDAIWEIIEDSGFSGGSLSEPAAGIGTFLGRMPKQLVPVTQIDAIEKDTLTGNLLKTIYPDANVFVGGYEEHKVKNKHDLVLTNVPFGDFSVYDKEYKYLKLSIHDYFIVKALDSVKPGGIVAVLTSRHTMDKKDSFARKQMAQRGDLVGAVRLPESAQKSQAGVTVATDLLFFKRRDKPLASLPDESLYSWIGTEAVEFERPLWMENGTFGDNDHIAPVNSYYVENPRQVLGKQEIDRGANGHLTVTVKSDKSVSEIASDLYSMAPIFKFNDTSLSVDTSDIQTTTKPVDIESNALVDSLINVDNDVHIVKEGLVSESIGLTGKRLARTLGMIEVKMVMNKVVHSQIDFNSDENNLKEALVDLNQKYDGFVRKFGFINDPSNARLFKADPEAGRLYALEKYDPDKKTAEKADIFSRRIISPREEIESFDSEIDALNYVVAQFGAIDMSRIAALVGGDEDTIAQSLLDEKAIFVNPQVGKYEIAAQYLSGNVREKLIYAKQALNDDPSMQVNIDELEVVKPDDIAFEDISIRPGAGWMGTEIYSEYLADKFSNSPSDFTADVRVSDGQWYVTYPKHLKGSSIASSDFGTRRINMFSLLERIMNQREIVIKDTHNGPDGKITVTNEDETLMAEEKASLIIEDFVGWLTSDIERKSFIEETYNFKMNGYVAPKYDGSAMTFPGMSDAIELRPHQKNAVMRSIISGNMLGAHEVGTGKTYTMISTSMEYKRLNLSTTPMIIVPNHMIEQIQREGLQLYPNANILAVSNDDLHADARKRFLGKVVNNNWDLIFITHSMYKKISVDPAFERRFINEQIATLRSELNVMEDNGAPRYSLKAIQKKLQRLETTLEAKLDIDRDQGITMEMMGVDFIQVDEAHNFKNLEIAGADYALSLAGSERSMDLFMKISAINEKRNDGRGVNFFTGTPVSNSLLEIFNMQRYLQFNTIKEMGVGNITAWANSFLTPVTQWEPDPSGSGFTLRTRHILNNIPELMRTWRQVMDVVTSDEAGIVRPNVTTENITAPMTQVQQQLMDELAERAVEIREGGVDPKDDNILKIVSEGRQSALDPRLVDETAPGPNPLEEITKIQLSVDKMIEIYKDTDEQKGAQLAFIDMGTPGRSGKAFNIYDLIKGMLIEKGIPENEISYIHDAKNDKQKGELFANVRSGAVRFLLGSTGKMGEGMNAQERLAGLHHIDPPWRPSDIEQRRGRMVRQGNIFKETKEFIYTTEGSFDLYMWNTLKVKADAFARILSGDETLRTFDAQVNPSYAETVAITTNNPLIRDKMDAEAKVNRLQRLEQAFETEKSRTKRDITYEETRIEEYQRFIVRLSELPDPIMLMDEDGEPTTSLEWEYMNPEYIRANEDVRGDIPETLTGTREEMLKALESLRKSNLLDLHEGVEVKVSGVEAVAFRNEGSIKTEWELNGRHYSGTASIETKILERDDQIKSYERLIISTEEEIKIASEKLNEENPYTADLAAAIIHLDLVDKAIETGKKDVSELMDDSMTAEEGISMA